MSGRPGLPKLDLGGVKAKTEAKANKAKKPPKDGRTFSESFKKMSATIKRGLTPRGRNVDTEPSKEVETVAPAAAVEVPLKAKGPAIAAVEVSPVVSDHTDAVVEVVVATPDPAAPVEVALLVKDPAPAAVEAAPEVPPTEAAPAEEPAAEVAPAAGSGEVQDAASSAAPPEAALEEAAAPAVPAVAAPVVAAREAPAPPPAVQAAQQRAAAALAALDRLELAEDSPIDAVPAPVATLEAPVAPEALPSGLATASDAEAATTPAAAVPSQAQAQPAAEEGPLSHRLSKKPKGKKKHVAARRAVALVALTAVGLLAKDPVQRHLEGLGHKEEASPAVVEAPSTDRGGVAGIRKFLGLE